MIVGLEEQSPAEIGGLLVGDTLVGIGGHPVSDPDELFASLSGEVVGKSTPIEVLCGEQLRAIAITIQECSAENQDAGDERHHHHREHRHGRQR